MVTVPRLTEQTVAPRASGVPFQDPSAPRAAFGTPIDAGGEQLQQLSSALAEAQERIQGRQAAVNRAKIRGETREQMQADFTAEMTAGSAFGAPNVLESYTNLQRERIEQGIAEHASMYGQDSALMLAEALENDLSNLTLSGAQAGVEAGKAAVMGEIDVFVRRQAAQAFADPGGVMDRFADIDQEILTQYADALTPQEERQVIENARSQVVESAANHFVVRSDFNSAEAVINNPVAIDNLSADAQRGIRSSIAQGRHQAAIRAAASQRAPTMTELALASIDGDDRALAAIRLLNPERPESEASSIPINLSLLRAQLGVKTGHTLVDAMSQEQNQEFYLAATDNNAQTNIDPFVAMMAAGNPELASMLQAGESNEDRRQRLFGPGAEVQPLGPVAPPVAGTEETEQAPAPRQTPQPTPSVSSDIQALSDSELVDLVTGIDAASMSAAEFDALITELERRGM